jgi:hypothetical protein
VETGASFGLEADAMVVLWEDGTVLRVRIDGAAEAKMRCGTGISRCSARLTGLNAREKLINT